MIADAASEGGYTNQFWFEVEAVSDVIDGLVFIEFAYQRLLSAIPNENDIACRRAARQGQLLAIRRPVE